MTGLTWVLRPTCHNSLRLGPLSPAARPRPSPPCPRKRPSKRLGTKRRCTRQRIQESFCEPKDPRGFRILEIDDRSDLPGHHEERHHDDRALPVFDIPFPPPSIKRDIEDRQRAIIMVPLFVMAWQIGAVIDLQDPETARIFWLAEALLNSGAGTSSHLMIRRVSHSLIDVVILRLEMCFVALCCCACWHLCSCESRVSFCRQNM